MSNKNELTSRWDASSRGESERAKTSFSKRGVSGDTSSAEKEFAAVHSKSGVKRSRRVVSTTRFASESVCAGHPDKVADAISDAVVDAVLAIDPNGRTAVETLVAHDRVVIAGEINTTAKLDIEAIVRAQIKRLGYTNPAWGFSDKSPIINLLHQQSPEISVGVDDFGAGDQGLMFGYASNETPEYLPTPIAP